MSKLLFRAIWFSISTLSSSIWLIDRTLSGAITPGQSEPWSDGNEGVRSLHSPKLQNYQSLSIRLFCVISRTIFGGILPFFRDTIGLFYSPSRLGNPHRSLVGIRSELRVMPNFQHPLSLSISLSLSLSLSHTHTLFIYLLLASKNWLFFD